MTSVSGVGAQDVEGALIPIAPLVCPVLLTKKTLAISYDSSGAPETWHYGGSASMHINTGITVGGGFTTHGVAGQKLWLRQLTLVRFPDICNAYSLQLYPPKWFRQVIYTIFQYVGSGVVDSIGKIDAVYDLLNSSGSGDSNYPFLL